MLVFNACFPMSCEWSVSDLLGAVLKWRAGSPHSNLSEELEHVDVECADVCLDIGSEKMILSRCDVDEASYGGVRYIEKNENDIQWTVEVVGRKSDEDFYASVKLFRDAPIPLINVPAPKKPYIIKNISKEKGFGKDVVVPVSSSFIQLCDNDIDLAQKLMLGQFGCRMPCVYVSVRGSGAPLVRPKTLSNMLSGMAHVFVEPSWGFSKSLKELVNGKNAYNGAVGIYCPDGESYWIMMPWESKSGSFGFEGAIFNKVREALLSQKPVSKCDWLSLQEVKSQSTIDLLKKDKTVAVERYMDVFDQDIKAKEEEIERLRQMVGRLNAQLSKAERGARGGGDAVLARGHEDNLYEHEVEDIVLDILDASLKSYPAGTRRHDIINDILKNNDVCGRNAVIHTEIKSVLKGYRTINKSIRKKLLDLGFIVDEEGKHIKIRFANDNRYVAVLSSTASDGRSGLNSASDLAFTML